MILPSGLTHPLRAIEWKIASNAWLDQRTLQQVPCGDQPSIDEWPLSCRLH